MSENVGEFDVTPVENLSRSSFLIKAGAVAGIGLAAIGFNVLKESDPNIIEKTAAPSAVTTEYTELPATTTTEIPVNTTTMEQWDVREILPEQQIATLTVQISGEGALQNTITHDVFADTRTEEQATAGMPIDIDANIRVLERGFVIYRDYYIPGWRENVVNPADTVQKYPTVIAGHRTTDITESPYGERVLMDIDHIQQGDRLSLVLDNGETVTYQATGSISISVDDQLGLERLFNTTSETETLLLYACDTSDTRGVPENGRYSPDRRYFVTYERIG